MKEANKIDIYSDEFKAWFGDWEQGKNCSLVVNKDGTPKQIDGMYINVRDGDPLFEKKLELAQQIAAKIKEYEKKYKLKRGVTLYETMRREELNEIVSTSPGVQILAEAIADGIVPELKVAVRYGNVREDMQSYNYRDQTWESGVSTLGSLKEYKESTYYRAFFGNQPLVVIIGYDVGHKGADGEMLLSPAKVICKYRQRNQFFKLATKKRQRKRSDPYDRER